MRRGKGGNEGRTVNQDRVPPISQCRELILASDWIAHDSVPNEIAVCVKFGHHPVISSFVNVSRGISVTSQS